MNILHLSYGSVFGGNEHQLFLLIKRLDEKGHKSIIFGFKDSPVIYKAKTENLNYYAVEKSSSFSISLAKKLKQYCEIQNIDIIHIQTSNFVSTFLVSSFLLRHKTPTVFSKKGISDKSSFFSRFKYNNPNIAKYLCVSKAVEDNFSASLNKKNRLKTTVVHAGIPTDIPKKLNNLNLRETYNIPKDAFIVGNIANHSISKDLKTFVNTANEVINIHKRENIYFVQIGEKSKFSEEFIPLVKKYGIENNVIFTDTIPRASDLIDQMDTFLFTSQNEGLGVSLLETSLRRTPIVTTNAGGIPEVIKNNVNGFITEVGNHKKLAEYIIKLIDNESLRMKISEKAYDTVVEQFSDEKMTNKILSIYKEVLNRN